MDDHEQHFFQELDELRVRLAGPGARQAPRTSSAEDLLLRVILDAIPDPAWIKDKAGRYIVVNAALCRLLGVEATAILGRTAHDFFPAEIAEQLAKQDQEILESGLSSRAGNLLEYSDGRPAWFETVNVPLRDNQGEVTGIVGTAHDVTERKRAEEALRQSEDRYRSLFNGMTEGFALHEIVCDEKGNPCDYRFLDINPGFERLTGLRRDDVVGKTVREVLPGEDPKWIETYGKVALTGQSARFEDYSVALDRHYDVFAYCPAPRHFAVLFSDVTERRKAEQERRRLEMRMLHAQKLESLGVLAGGIAHDFNNILAGIVGYADLAMSDLPPLSRACSDIEEVRKAAQRAGDLTRQLLAYSGAGKFVVERVDLSRSVEDLRRMLDLAVSKKAAITWSLARDLPTIQADASQIGQIVMNLVINASEALEDRPGKISISTALVQCTAAEFAAMGCEEELPAGSYVRLEVADTGCGMDRETLGRAFDPFFSTKAMGRGLGLAAIHGIVRGHKGAILVSSEPGRGSIFRVFFPVASAEPRRDPVAAAPPLARRDQRTVLVVDDEESIRKLTGRMIEHIGLSALTAADSQEAVRLFTRHREEIACVILDANMPKVDGAATLRQLREISPDVRVILSSGSGDEQLIRRFDGLNLAGFIQKPHSLDAMLARLREVIGERS